MFHDKMIFYSSIGNRLKKLYRNNNPLKLFHERSFTYLDNNGEKIKLKYEIEKERRLFNEFISNMRNYKILDEIKRKNYLSKLKGYKGIDEEKKITELRQKRFNDILELRKRRELINRNISLLNVPSIGKICEQFLLDVKRKRNNFSDELFIQSQGNNNSPYRDMQIVNKTSLLSFNSSLNSEKTNIQRNKRNLKFVENNSKKMRNIIRTRINFNKSTNNIISQKKNQISLFRLKLKKSNKRVEFNSQLMSLKETYHTNIYSNESNSAIANFNSTLNATNTNNINSYSKKITNIKSAINNNFFKENKTQLNSVQVQMKSRFISNRHLFFDKLKYKNDSYNFTNKDNIKLNSVRNIDTFKNNSVSPDKRNKSHELNKRFYKFKKNDLIRFKVVSNNYKASNSPNGFEQEKGIIKKNIQN
jgi:hypothetical protein